MEGRERSQVPGGDDVIKGWEGGQVPVGDCAIEGWQGSQVPGGDGVMDAMEGGQGSHVHSSDGGIGEEQGSQSSRRVAKMKPYERIIKRKLPKRVVPKNYEWCSNNKPINLE